VTVVDEKLVETDLLGALFCGIGHSMRPVARLSELPLSFHGCEWGSPR
jgi:hypothetical protein